MGARTFHASALNSGSVYRTADFGAFTANPARLVEELEHKGILRRLAHGLYMRVDRTKFGGVRRAEDDELLSAFLGDDNFIITGSDVWNTLGLGAKAVLASPIVYNHQRVGEIVLDGRRFLFKKCKFPRNVTAEWYVVDLIENHDTAQLGLDDAYSALIKALESQHFSAKTLVRAAVNYGSVETRRLVHKAVVCAGLAETGFARGSDETINGSRLPAGGRL
jgi:hypothetical protein